MIGCPIRDTCHPCPVHTEDIPYTADAIDMLGHLARPDGGSSRPAVLLCHEGGGLNDNVKARAERLADLGFVAFALDYFGGGRLLPLEEAMALLIPLTGDADRTRALAGAGLDVLVAQPQVDPARVAVAGYCFGGAMALELARSGADVKAIVGFHPGLTSPRPADSRRISAPVLMCCGADDPIITADHRAAFETEMRDAAVRDWRIELYGGVVHSFTNPAAADKGIPGLAYDAAADRRSWRSFLDLLAETVGTA
jgi:dienelactone hydrolase